MHYVPKRLLGVSEPLSDLHVPKHLSSVPKHPCCDNMPEFLCELCTVSVNSHDQLVIHRNGKRHSKNLKVKGFLSSETAVATSTTSPTTAPDPSKMLYGKFVAASAETSKPPVTPLTAQPSSSTDKAPPVPAEDALPTEFTPKVPKSAPMFRKPAHVDLLANLPGSNPIEKAIMGNALGKLPTKKRKYDGRCDYCNVDYTSESQEYQHLSGSKHIKKKKLVDATRAYTESLSMPMGFTGFTCQYCNVQLNTMDQYEFHRKGQKHKKNLELLKKMGKATEESKGVVMSVTAIPQ
ncbi:hypothetical protein FSP39_020818 [Pinctada imbricata]|uniref:C2H2-type domain-containing protein n=1 Tax=Pinctada imbricata TaxID=66713 RepID=A0AA88XNH0_PINIB|nr:hypothetical protein FSP39_020818 [Pinctada imbricata]